MGKRKKWLNKRKVKLIGGIVALGVVVVGVGGVWWSRQKDTSISAHPTDKIILNSGYEVKTDSLSITEPLLSGNPTFDDYKQGNEVEIATEKNVVNAYSTVGSDLILEESVKVLNDGRVICANFSVDIYTSSNMIRSLDLLLLDSDSNVLDRKNAATGMVFPSKDQSGSRVNGSYSYGRSPVFDNGDGSFSYLYIGYTKTNRLAETLNRVTFKLVGNTLTDFSWEENIQFKYATDEEKQNRVTFKTLPGKDPSELYEYGFSTGDGGTELMKWSDDNGQFESAALLKIPNTASYLTPPNPLWGVWPVFIGYDNINDGYYGSVNIRAQGLDHGIYDSYLVFWNKTGDMKKIIDMGYTKNTGSSDLLNFKVLPAISNSKVIYVSKIYTDKVELVKIPIPNGYGAVNEQVLATLPKGSTIDMQESDKYGSSYVVWGQYGNGSGDFDSIVKSNQFFLIYLDHDYEELAGNAMGGFSGSVEIKTMVPSNNKIYIFGQGTSSDFVSNIPEDGWAIKDNVYKEANMNSIFGTLNIVEDYSPVIKLKENPIIDITDTANLESNLLKVADVYDTYELSPLNISGQKSMNWLRERLNIDPESIIYDGSGNLVTSSEIDWQALGFDKNTTGPQQVTYFITDYSGGKYRQSVSSTWINKKTAETISKNEYHFDAQNFAISLTDVTTDITNEEDFKKLAKTDAWYTNGSYAPVEDEKSVANIFNPAKVKVNTSQLIDLQNAKIAKPYPVDVSYTPTGGTSITNRVWVFVTTKNTVVDTKADVVIYANDFELPYGLASSQTDKDVYEQSDVKVYQYKDTTHEKDSDCDMTSGSPELPTIANKKVTGQLTSNANPAITTAPAPGVIITPDKVTIRYTNPTNNEVASAPIEVTLSANVRLHLRQVVFEDQAHELEELIIPEKGHYKLKNDANESHVIVSSGKEGDSIVYKDFYTDIDYTGSRKIQIEAIIPEYYELKGYVETDIDTPHASSQIVSSNPLVYEYDFTSGTYEKWVTVYLSPKLNATGRPQVYQWEYDEESFGKIEKN